MTCRSCLPFSSISSKRTRPAELGYSFGPKSAPTLEFNSDAFFLGFDHHSTRKTGVTFRWRGPLGPHDTLVLWMRDLLGGTDDPEDWRQRVYIGRLVAPVGQLGLSSQAAVHDLLGERSFNTR